MKRSRSDTGQRNEYGQRKCPRCGDLVSKSGFGFNSHLKSCLQKDVTVDRVTSKGCKLVEGRGPDYTIKIGTKWYKSSPK